MPHIDTHNDIPGIRGLMLFRPETATALNHLAQALLVDDSPLSRADRELIATFTSRRNDCTFCMTSHGAIAANLMEKDYDLVRAVWEDYRSAPIPEKLKSLLHIASQVQKGGKHVSEADIAAARAQGASDLEIHDTVLIAAAFCMFNRYVDGLGATTPDDLDWYDMIGAQRAQEGYLTKSVLVR